MENNEIRYSDQVSDAVFSLLMRKVYSWMTIALFITGITAYVVSSNHAFMEMLYTNSIARWGLIIAQLGTVIVLTTRIQRMSIQLATSIFILYSFLTGITFSTIFAIYTQQSIASTFLIAAAVFLVTSIYGWVTKRDLTKIGSLAFMGLMGIILASVINFFLQSTMMMLIVSYIAVVIFVGLIAYDTQKLKQLALQCEGDEDMTHRFALIGALSLYLDLINLFIQLLNILGRRR